MDDSGVSIPTFTFSNCPPVPEKIVILLCNAGPNFCLCSLMLSYIYIFYLVSSISFPLHFFNLFKGINPSTVGRYLHTLSLHENPKGRNNTSPLYSKSDLTVHFLSPKFCRYEKPTKAKFTSLLAPLYHFQILFDAVVDKSMLSPTFFWHYHLPPSAHTTKSYSLHMVWSHLFHL